MNLTETIKGMGKPQELEESQKTMFGKAGRELQDYARKSGGVDKADFEKAGGFMYKIAMANIADKGTHMSSFSKFFKDLDTDVRDRIVMILKKNNIMEEVIVEAPEDNEPASPDEGSMAMQQLEFIEYAADRIGDHIEQGGKFPEWMQNKLATVNDNMQSLYSQIDQDGEEMDEAKRDPSKSGGSGYDLYHKDFSSAMQHAYKYAKDKLGVEIDPKEIDDKVASGPRKPSKGKTNSYRLKGKDGKKGVQIQVANLDDKKFELNMYKESVDLEEAREDIPRQVARLILGMGVRQSAPESEIIKRIPFALKKLGLQNDKLIQRDPDFKGEVIDDFRSMKEEVELDEAKSKEQQIADLEKMLDRISGNTSSVKMKKFALQRKIDKLKNEELEEAYKTPAEAGAYEAGKKAARAGKKYDDNPNKKGSKEHTAWSKGHNEARAKGMKEEVELDEAMRVLAKKGRTQVVTKGDGVAKVMVGNKEVASGDLDDGAGGWFMSRPGEKGQKFFDSPKKIADFYAEEVEMSEEVNLDELFESAFEEELAEAKYQVTVKGAGRETVMARTEKEAIDKATRKMGVRTHGKKNEIEVKMIEEDAVDRHGNTKSFLDAIMNVVSEKKELDPVNKKALKKDFDDRKDKDLDNDGDTDDSDEYLHKKRQAVSKAMEKDSDKAEADQEKEVSKKEDEPKGKVGKSNKQTKVDVNPSIEEEKGEEMTSAEMEKRDEIMKSLEKKKDEFVKKYGDRAKEVMARTAIKMAKKHA